MSQISPEEIQDKNNSGIFWGRCWIVVTGASRGLGSAICKGLASVVQPGSSILGLARSIDGLNETAKSVNKINPGIQFTSGVIDFSTTCADDMIGVLQSSLDLNLNYDRALIFHNAGSLGDLDYLRSINSVQETSTYYQLNVGSVIVFNSYFLQVCQTLRTKNINVINISSLCAVSPMKSWGLYCSGKAARDMVFKVLALEQENLQVLNYAPGPLDNDMQMTARNSTADPELRSLFLSLKNEGKLLKESDSVEKLLKILSNSCYKSGDHVDYYDDM